MESTIQPYTLGSFDTVDMEFNTVTDQYRASINGGTYTDWKNFINPVDSVDTIELATGSAQPAGSTDIYWDDVRFNN